MLNFDFNTKNNFKEANEDLKFAKLIKQFAKTTILVGIPEEKTKRRKKKDQTMNNATLLFIHTNGSPKRNLPARPLIEPALSANDNAEKISSDLKEVGKKILDQDLTGAKRLMKVTGIDAVNIVRTWFNDPRNEWPPDARATVNAKLRKNKQITLGERREMLDDFELGIGGINQTLVDTGQLRKAITYVIREEGE